MKYSGRTDQVPGQWDSESAKQSRPEIAERRLASDVPQPSRPEELSAVGAPEKAMAASCPGTEYWLP